MKRILILLAAICCLTSASAQKISDIYPSLNDSPTMSTVQDKFGKPWRAYKYSDRSEHVYKLEDGSEKKSSYIFLYIDARLVGIKMFDDISESYIKVWDLENGLYDINVVHKSAADDMASVEKHAGNPNLAIAMAIKKSGAFSLGVGVPLLAVGTVLVGYGYTKTEKVGSGKYTVTSVPQSALNCRTAGLVLMGVGGGKTLVGIPLYCFGRKAELQIKASGTGAGLALNF